MSNSLTKPCSQVYQATTYDKLVKIIEDPTPICQDTLYFHFISMHVSTLTPHLLLPIFHLREVEEPHNLLSLSRLFISAISISLLTLSIHLNFGLPLLLLPPLLFFLLSLSISLHSFSVCVLPIVVCSPLPSSSGVSLFPDYLNSPIFLLSFRVTLRLFLT